MMGKPNGIITVLQFSLVQSKTKTNWIQILLKRRQKYAGKKPIQTQIQQSTKFNLKYERNTGIVKPL